jgi:ArsR family transcriptional regulator
MNNRKTTLSPDFFGRGDLLDSFEETAGMLKLLSDKNRLMILSMLREREMCVCDLVDALETTQPNVSQHLRKLKSGGLVTETRRMQWIYYSLHVEDKPLIKQIIDRLPPLKDKLDKVNPDCCKP